MVALYELANFTLSFFFYKDHVTFATEFFFCIECKIAL